MIEFNIEITKYSILSTVFNYSFINYPIINQVKVEKIGV